MSTVEESPESSDPRLSDKLDILARLPDPDASVRKTLSVPNYAPDHAIREAIQTGSLWKRQEGIPMYRATNNLRIYLAQQTEPLPAEQALEVISHFNASTAFTARIALGLWNTRRYTKELTVNGAVPLKIEEILAWRGIKKHSHAAYSGSSKRYTNGYEAKYKEAVMEDLKILAMCCVKGNCVVNIKGKYVSFEVHSQYLNYSPVYRTTIWGDKILEGIFLNAGDWVNVYDEYENKYVAEAERAVFTLNPKYQQAEIRIALYLIERWRNKAKMQEYDAPIEMQTLLQHSAIIVDKKHLTDRFIPRIEEALKTLHRLGILGEVASPITPLSNRPSADEWLTSQWRLIPPAHIIEHYKNIVHSVAAIATRKKTKRTKKVKEE